MYSVLLYNTVASPMTILLAVSMQCATAEFSGLSRHRYMALIFLASGYGGPHLAHIHPATRTRNPVDAWHIITDLSTLLLFLAGRCTIFMLYLASSLLICPDRLHVRPYGRAIWFTLRGLSFSSGEGHSVWITYGLSRADDVLA